MKITKWLWVTLASCGLALTVNAATPPLPHRGHLVQVTVPDAKHFTLLLEDGTRWDVLQAKCKCLKDLIPGSVLEIYEAAGVVRVKAIVVKAPPPRRIEGKK